MEGEWRLIAAPEDGAAPLKIRQQVRVLDARLPAGSTIEIPQSDGMDPLLYFFDGTIEAVGTRLGKGDALAPIQMDRARSPH